MFLRNLLFLCFCVIVAAGIGFYVFPTHAYLVWGLLFLCWACFRLKLRADSLFGRRRAVLSSGQNGSEARSNDAAH
jgi:hypothetical protein